MRKKKVIICYKGREVINCYEEGPNKSCYEERYVANYEGRQGMS